MVGWYGLLFFIIEFVVRINFTASFELIALLIDYQNESGGLLALVLFESLLLDSPILFGLIDFLMCHWSKSFS